MKTSKAQYNFHSLIIIMVLSLTASCSNIRPINKHRPQYDADVEQSFEEIERQKILNYYFELRKKSVDKKPARKRRKKRAVKVYRPARPKKVSSPKILTDPNENKIRMEQILSYYCIKNSNKSNCKQFTQAVSSNCKDSFDMDDQRIIRCIEKKLGNF